MFRLGSGRTPCDWLFSSFSKRIQTEVMVQVWSPDNWPQDIFTPHTGCFPKIHTERSKSLYWCMITAAEHSPDGKCMFGKKRTKITKGIIGVLEKWRNLLFHIFRWLMEVLIRPRPVRCGLLPARCRPGIRDVCVHVSQTGLEQRQ